MKGYSKPKADIVNFSNKDNNMVLLSSNYNSTNMIRSSEVNRINLKE